MQGYEPFLFRAAALSDLDELYTFSKVAGLTNIPPDHSLLASRIQESIQSFSRVHQNPHPDDFYFFVIEDLRLQRIAGCSAIYADVGSQVPYYTLRVDKFSLLLNKELHHVTEIGALYLSPDYRHHHIGAFLSRARFLFMASYPQYFHDIVIAEMRGRRDNQNQSPFWEDFSHHYIRDKSFVEADLELARHHPAFIDQLLPHDPIALNSLTKRARACIGVPGRSTRPAVTLLNEEHFVLSKYINVFDAGPLMIARAVDINTVALSTTKTFSGIAQPKDTTLHFISTQSNDFRVVVSPIDIQANACYLPEPVVKQLNLSLNDTIRIAPF